MTMKRNMCVTFSRKSKNFALRFSFYRRKSPAVVCAHIYSMSVKCLTVQKLFAHSIERTVRKRQDRRMNVRAGGRKGATARQRFELLDFPKHMCNAIRLMLAEASGRAKHFRLGMHPTRWIVCFAHSVALTFCCFSWALFFAQKN